MRILFICLFIACSLYAQDLDNITIAKVEKWTDNNKNEFNVSVSSTNMTWRFIHDGKTLHVKPFLSDGKTTTKLILIEAKTEESAWVEIRRLKLTVTTEDILDE